MDAERYDAWYETPRGRWIGGRELGLVKRALALEPGNALLDVGCGTGYFTRGLAGEQHGPVVGLDIELRWVAYARQRDDGRRRWVVGDAQRLPFPDHRFDRVMSITALCFVADERLAVREMVRVARRRVVLGLLNRHSLLWWQKGRRGGQGAYRGARWHTAREARALFDGLPVTGVSVSSAIWLPDGGRLARHFESWEPTWLHGGAFLLVVAELADPAAS
ncbi:class I SAM-dependent methyltransferase [Halomonas sp. 3H]|uniref:class I SAM-dependent methyltransferase n=1 Tax=Halomonas sp. 3H TaxID=2952527 RepID=UPI0020B68E94|nr:class I SAM-dependent methyltransferase [Halomonas sp. 3H]